MSLNAITVYDNGFLQNNAFSRIHGLNFVGTGVTIEVPTINFIDDIGIATVRFTSPVSINDLNDVNTGSPVIGQVLKWSGTEWIASADLSGGGGSGEIYWSSTSSGINIHTLSNVGIGTTIPTSELHVVGNARIVGTITATSFVGDGSGLTNLLGTSQWITTSAGIHTLSNVGIGTTNPTEKLHVDGNVSIGNTLYFAKGDSSGIFFGNPPFNSGQDSSIWVSDSLYPNSFIFSNSDYGAKFITRDISLNRGTLQFVGLGTTSSSFGGPDEPNYRVGIGTTNPRFALEVGAVGTSGTSLFVNGNARITGILTVGSSSISLDGINDILTTPSIISSSYNTLKQSDPDFSSVVLLLPMDGANNSTTFTDASSYSRTATVVGNSKISTVQSKFGGSSAYFDGDGDYISFADSSDFDLSSGNYTVEFWIRPDSLSTDTVPISKRAAGAGNGWEVGVSPSGTIYIIGPTNAPYGPSNFVQTPAGVISAGVWQHCAIQRSGSTTKIYVNGVERVSGTMTITQSSGLVLSIGSRSQNTPLYPYAGYIDDFRITKGIARYSGNFNPTTSSFSSYYRPLQISDLETNGSNNYLLYNLGIGSTNPTEKLTVSGVTSTTSLFSTNSATIDSLLISQKSLSGTGNIRIGNSNTLGSSSGGEYNIAIGQEALSNVKNSDHNIAIGYQSANNFNIGDGASGYNVSIGHQSFTNIYNGNNNVAIGWRALYGSGFTPFFAGGNVAVGSNAGRVVRNIRFSQLFGESSGYNLDSGDWNTFLGWWSGYNITTGNYNIYLGSVNGKYSTVGDHRIIIGNGNGNFFGREFDAPSSSSKQLAIGFNTTGTSEYWLVGNENLNIGIGTTNPTSRLHVVGNASFSGIVTSNSLLIGQTGIATGYFNIATSDLGEGIPNPSVIISSVGKTPIVLAGDTTDGTTSGGVIIPYYASVAGGKWKSALEIFNTNSPSIPGKLLLMKSGGYVGIGTTNPTEKLTIYNGGISLLNPNKSPFTISQLVNNTWIFGTQFDSSPTSILVNNTSRLTVNNSGASVTGILTATSLDISQDVKISGITTSTDGFTSGIGVTNPVKITVTGNVLTFSVVGVGSTSFILY